MNPAKPDQDLFPAAPHGARAGGTVAEAPAVPSGRGADLADWRRPATSDAPVRPSPLTAMRNRWYGTALLAVLGLLAGLAVAETRTRQYTAEARLVVGRLDVGSQSVPGFTFATQELAATYSRLIVSDQVRTDLRTALGGDFEEVLDYDASPIPESAIIRVEAVATDPRIAVQATDAAATALGEQVQQLLLEAPGPDLLTQYTESRSRVAAATLALQQAQAALELATSPAARQSAQAAVQAAQSQVDTLTLQSETLAERYEDTINEPVGAPVQVVANAAVASNDRLRTLQIFGLAGLTLGLLAALLLSTLTSARAARRSGARAPGRVVRPESSRGAAAV